MKELSIEQKAKAYDEAKERAKRMFSEKELNYLFPELKESDDERIRKALIRFHNSTIDIDGIKGEDIIAWLEKQGKKMSDPRYSIFDKLIEADNIYQMSMNAAMTEEAKNKAIEALSNLEVSKVIGFEKQGERKSDANVEPKFTVGDTIINIYYRLDGSSRIREIKDGKYIFDDGSYITIKEQDSWELVDKNRPKFKVGDWVVSDYNSVAYIESISGTKYNLQCKDGYHDKMSIEYVDGCWHLWTIADAKDGDILATDKGVFIYAKVLYNKPYAYCGVDKFGVFKDNCLENNWANSVDNIHPATKERRDLLFAKIRDAGYEWDADKKELKTIEQKPTDKVEPKFHEGDWIVWELCELSNTLLITKIDKSKNRYLFNDNTDVSFSDERYLHLWTLEDAKDGDVLTVDDERPFIFKGCLDPNHPDSPVAYCGIGTGGYFCVGGSKFNHWWTNEKVHPATKEQRDALMKVMVDAGYTFDFEKKELKKIEQKSVIKMITPEESLGISSEEYNKIVDECIYGDDKPAWSEKDEEIRQTIINEFEQCSEWYCSNGLTKEDCINWLNKQEHFKLDDEDYENMNSLCVLLDQMVSINAIGDEHSIEYKNWMKSLKQRLGG